MKAARPAPIDTQTSLTDSSTTQFLRGAKSKAHAMPTQALIYTRVSSVAQTKRGSGLDSQELTCRRLVDSMNVEVVGVYSDDVSGERVSRPGIDALLDFMRRRKKRQFYVVIDDISRLARDVTTHEMLRKKIKAAGGILISPNMAFAEDAQSRTFEGMSAVMAQFQRLKNKEQTLERMIARVLRGYWPFAAPIGYIFANDPHGPGRVLVWDEPYASIMKEMLEGFASGRFVSQAECKRFLDASGFPKGKSGYIRFQRIKDFLTNPVYAGLVHARSWGIDVRPGKHEGLISVATFQKIAERLEEPKRAEARKGGYQEDYPLRGAVECSCCGVPLTACWSTSRSGKKHPYYRFPSRECENYGKSVRRDQLEGEFVQMLEQMAPSEALIELFAVLFKDIWAKTLKTGEARKQALSKQIRELDRDISRCLDKIVSVETQSVIRAFEQRIQSLETKKLALEEEKASAGQPRYAFDDVLTTGLIFISNVEKAWKSGVYELRRLVLRLVFTERLVYDRKRGLTTPQVSAPFRFLASLEGGGKLARPAGFEPATAGLEGRCSIQLSYNAKAGSRLR